MANGVRSFVVLLFQKLIFNVIHHHHLSQNHHNETDLKKESTEVSRIPSVSSKIIYFVHFYFGFDSSLW